MDDDMTGTSFKRFDKIISRIERGEIEVLVFKDASRLGRNLKESLIFVETLENYGVEILFESEDYDEDFFPLKAWFNEQRAKEDSKKIRRVMRHKMESGELLVKSIYGYSKSPNNELIINTETAEVVKRIYSLFKSGYGTRQIAAMLNKENIPTPSQANGNALVSSCWNPQHIYRIITNDVYTGKMTHGKKTNISYKNKKVISTDPESWVIVDNHHEAIISQKEFDEIQELRTKFSTNRYKGINRPFSGLLECGRCGSSLVVRLRKGRKDNYICAKANREGAIKDDIRPDYGCKTHVISEDYLYEIIYQYISNLLMNNITDEEVDGIYRQSFNVENFEERIKELKNKCIQTEKIISNIYDDKLAGLINGDFFKIKYEEYNNLLIKYKQQLDELQGRQHSLKKSPSKTELKKLLDKIQNRTVTSAMLRQIFEKIIVYLPTEIPETVKQRYKISDTVFDEIYENGGLLFIEAITRAVGSMAQ